MKFFFLARYVKNRKTWAHTAPTKIYANIAYFGLNEFSISLNTRTPTSLVKVNSTYMKHKV